MGSALKALLLACAVSSFTVQAVPPPSALIQGAEYRPAYIKLFEMLVDYSWRRAEIRVSEHERRTMILVGQDAAIEEAMREAGWQILTPPFYPSSTSLVVHLPPISGNLEGVDRIVGDLRTYLIPGGFFVVPPITLEPALVIGTVMDLIMRGFRNTQFTVELNHRKYSIWQKKSHWLRTAA